MALAEPRACGSGLKHAGCCGLNLAALDRSPPDASLLALMARAPSRPANRATPRWLSGCTSRGSDAISLIATG